MKEKLVQKVFFSDKRLLYLFAIYGLAINVVLAIIAPTIGIENIPYEWDFYDIAFFLNYPAVITLMYIEFFVISSGGVSAAVHTIQIILLSTIVWASIGFLFYALSKMFKLERTAEK